MSTPKFFEAGVSSDDFSQGTLGNCWFVAACACLAEDKKLWKKVLYFKLQFSEAGLDVYMFIVLYLDHDIVFYIELKIVIFFFKI